MSAAKDISYLIIDGVFDTLNGSVTVGATTYPVYKTIPKNPADTYVKIGELIEGAEDGTSDDFIYNASLSIHVVDCTQNKQGDRKKAQNILNKVRSLLRTGKGVNPSISGLIVFALNGKTESINLDDISRPEIRLTDLYRIVIE